MMNNLPSGILYSLTGAAAVASLTSCATGKQKEEQKPLNIVYIMTDDHTAQMMSCYDTRYIENSQPRSHCPRWRALYEFFCSQLTERPQPCLHDHRQT